MKTTLIWKKGFWKNTCEIFSNGIPVGKLTDSFWSQTADGELNGKEYRFVTRGFFKQETQIIQANTETMVGRITYNSWRTRATIDYMGRIVSCKFNNIWHTKWCLYDAAGVLADYQGSSFTGTIEFNHEDDLMVLAGLYITNYFRQISAAAVVIVFLPFGIIIT